MNIIKKATEMAKMRVEGAMQRSPLEKCLFNVTSNLENIPAHSDMEFIADSSNQLEDTKMTMRWIGKKLRKNNNKRVIIRVSLMEMAFELIFGAFEWFWGGF